MQNIFKSNEESENYKTKKNNERIKELKRNRFTKVYSKENFKKDMLKINKNIEKEDNLYKRKIDIKYKNMNIYNYIIKKTNIPNNRFKQIDIDKDGNCFYKCVSYFLYGNKKQHGEIRSTISNVCKGNLEELCQFQEFVEIRKDEYVKTREYINNMINTEGNWATNIDISVTSYLYDINIAIYLADDEDNLKYAHMFSYEEQNYLKPLLLLVNENFNHFNIIYDIEEFEDNDLQNSNEIIISQNSDSENNTSSKFENNKIIQSDNKKDLIEETEYKEKNNSKVKYKYENNNPYPKYVYGEDENLYLNIYNYLNNGLIKNKRVWPKYIEDIKDKRKKDEKKIDFCRKIGIYKRKKKNKDNKQGNSKYKYLVEKNNLYVIKKYKNEKFNNEEQENSEEEEYIEKKYKIPRTSEIKDILFKHHDNHLHQGRDGTYYSIKEDNYDWVGMKNDVELYIKNCVDCAKMKSTEKSKKEKSITILSRGPKDRYVADLWYLPEYLKGHSNYLYVLDIIDHFSKFFNSYLLNTKEKFEIFTHIRDFIDKYGKHNYLVTDNGTEFKNKILTDYCKENRIKFIHGLPYRPHQQGVVERLHRVIKKGLNSYKLKLKKTYNIDYAIAEIVRIKNNTYCRTTKETPNNLFFKEFTQEEIKNINLKMLDSQKYSNKYKNTYCLNEKILLNINLDYGLLPQK